MADRPGTPEKDIVITLRPERWSVPGHARLKRFLKHALRCYGLRCVDLKEAPAAEETAPPPAGETAADEVTGVNFQQK